MRFRSTPACRFGIAVVLLALTSSVLILPRVSSSDAIKVEGGLIALSALAVSPLGYLAIPFLAATSMAAAKALF